jgi:Zn ribbon nucleic-acid-binding protein
MTPDPRTPDLAQCPQCDDELVWYSETGVRCDQCGWHLLPGPVPVDVPDRR